MRVKTIEAYAVNEDACRGLDYGFPFPEGSAACGSGLEILLGKAPMKTALLSRGYQERNQ